MKITIQIPFYILAFLLVSACRKDKDSPKTIISPTVITGSVNNITSTTADCGGNVTDAGGGHIAAKGICWSTNQFPIIERDNKTIDGEGTGEFFSSLVNLKSNITYYVRAYATNEVGTSYGDDVMFTTSPFATFLYNGETIFVHPGNSGSSVWGPAGVTTGAISPGDGSSNTIYINNQQGTYAAKVCSELVAYGFSDWYLPSSEELYYIFQAKTVLGGFGNGDYWSSTETSDQNATSINFQNGVKTTTSNKNQSKLCHCVRKD